MRKLLIFLLLYPCMWITAQRNANFGIIGGIAYYMGDINPNRHFYKPSPAFGLIYRININPRYAIRGNAYYAQVRGSDLDFPELLHPDRAFLPVSFTTTMLDLNLQTEFNFLPFTPNVGKFKYTPYVSGGLGFTLAMSANTNHHFTFPFGVGVKFNLTSKISTGAEWSFRKSFTDHIDRVENPTGIQSLIHNNDWYSYLAVFITYKFFKFAEECPAYR